MKLKYVLPVALLTAILVSCSSVKPPSTSALPDKTPQVSKVVETKMERFLKRKVAIARFTNETKYGQGFFYDQNDDRLAHLTKEKEIGSLGNLNISADYLILGSVSEFGRKTTSDVGVFSRSKKQTAYAKVSVRLVDVRTGQIVYPTEQEKRK